MKTAKVWGVVAGGATIAHFGMWEAQKPKTFQIAAFHAQKLSGQSVGIHFAATRQKTRKPLSCLKISCNISKCVIISFVVLKIM